MSFLGKYPGFDRLLMKGYLQSGADTSFPSNNNYCDNLIISDDKLLISCFKYLLRVSKARSKFIEPEIFSDPAWNMLLYLAIAGIEGSDATVSSCILACGVAETSGQRWLDILEDNGLIVRGPVDENASSRRVAISSKGLDAMVEAINPLTRDDAKPA